MIAGLSKAITLYLAPVLMLTSILLSLFAYLAPVLMLQTRVSLMSVVPSTKLTDGDGSDVDGPSVFMGALGSCSRTNNDAAVNCTIPVFEPRYGTSHSCIPSYASLTYHPDVSVLPNNAPTVLLSAPAATTPVFIGLSIAFSIVFFFTFTLISFQHKMGKAGGMFAKPLIQRMSAWIGFFGFMMGSYLVSLGRPCSNCSSQVSLLSSSSACGSARPSATSTPSSATWTATTHPS